MERFQTRSHILWLRPPLQAEDAAHKNAAAAQRFLDEVLAAADTPPVCYLPLLERLLLEKGMPEALQVRHLLLQLGQRTAPQLLCCLMLCTSGSALTTATRSECSHKLTRSSPWCNLPPYRWQLCSA